MGWRNKQTLLRVSVWISLFVENVTESVAIAFESRSMGHAETVYKWIHTSIIKTSSAHSIDLMRSFLPFFWNFDRTTRRALFEALRTSYFFQFCPLTFTPLLKKLATGVGHLNRFWGPGEGNLTAKNQKSQMPGVCRGRGGGRGMLMFQIDLRISGASRPHCTATYGKVRYILTYMMGTAEQLNRRRTKADMFYIMVIILSYIWPRASSETQGWVSEDGPRAPAMWCYRSAVSFMYSCVLRVSQSIGFT